MMPTPEMYVTLTVSGRPVASIENPELCRLVAHEAVKTMQGAVSEQCSGLARLRTALRPLISPSSRKRV